MIERIAERQCGKSWHKIRHTLEALQVTEFFNLNHRVLMRNEPPHLARNILKSLKIKHQKQVLQVSQPGENP
jgi:hypothetical protein